MKNKYEEDCRIPFKLTWRFRRGSAKFCGIELKDRKIHLDYVSIPGYVRFGNAPFIRFLKSEEGQNAIECALKGENCERRNSDETNNL